MSKPSNWPLRDHSQRLVSPVVIRRQLQQHALSRDCYPRALGFYEHAHGHEIQRLQHDDNILIYCFDGCGTLQTEKWSGSIRSGDLAILPSGVSHQYAADKQDPWSIYWCHFGGERASDYIAHMEFNDKAPVTNIGRSALLISHFRATLDESSRGFNIVAMLHAASMLKQLLTMVAKLKSEQQLRSSDSFNIDDIQAYMLQNLDRSINLATLAHLAGLSRFHFSKRYKQLTGIAPIEHLLKMKVEYAKYLLETNDMAVSVVAEKVGYEDALYFSRLFKKHTGYSPTQYRKTTRTAKQ